MVYDALMRRESLRDRSAGEAPLTKEETEQVFDLLVECAGRLGYRAIIAPLPPVEGASETAASEACPALVLGTSDGADQIEFALTLAFGLMDANSTSQ